MSRVLGFDGPRGKRMSMPASGGWSTPVDGRVECSESAFCPCGKRFDAREWIDETAPRADKLALAKRLLNEAQDQWWECLRQHEFDEKGDVTKGNPRWEQFEKLVQDSLDLRSPPGSGNQWSDVGDGVSKVGDPYKLIVDCKFTESGSYRLSGDVLYKWWVEATGRGLRFALPVHIDGTKAGSMKQWATIPFDDYVELVETYRMMYGPTRCGVKGSTASQNLRCCRKAGHFGHHDNGEVEWS